MRHTVLAALTAALLITGTTAGALEAPPARAGESVTPAHTVEVAGLRAGDLPAGSALELQATLLVEGEPVDAGDGRFLLVSDGAAVPLPPALVSAGGGFRVHGRTLGLGSHAVAVRWTGGAEHDPVTSDPVEVTVTRDAGEVRGRFRPRGLPRAGRGWQMRATTSSTGGLVQVFFRNREVARGRPRARPDGSGVVDLRAHHRVPAGERELVLRWSGSRAFSRAGRVLRTRFLPRTGFVVPRPPLPAPAHPFRVLWDEGFTDGLGGWQTAVTAPEGGDPAAYAWRHRAADDGAVVTEVPRHDACTPDTVSGASTLTSPPFTVTADRPRLELHQDGALAAGDGMTVAVSVDGGAFTPVPARAWAPGADVSPTGSGPGAATGVLRRSDSTYGPVVVGLARAGVRPGQRVRVRLAVARDACGEAGVWAVDRVRLVSGQEPSRFRAVSTTPGGLGDRVLRLPWGKRITFFGLVGTRDHYLPTTHPTGRLRLVGTRGDVLDRARLGPDGARLALDTARLPLGEQALYVVHDGDARYAPFVRRQPLRFRVVRAEGTLDARFQPRGLPTAGRRFRMRVDIPDATGTVRVLFRGRTIARERVDPTEEHTDPPRVFLRTWRGVPAGERWLRVVWDGGRGHTRASEVVRTRFVRR